MEVLSPPTAFFVDSLDENGMYDWDDSNATSADYYSIGAVVKENYFNISSPISIFGNREDIVLDPFAWLHLNVIDDDSIPGDYCKSAALFIQPNRIGEFEDLFLLRGNREIQLKTKKEVGTDFITEFLYLPALDTLHHEIRF